MNVRQIIAAAILAATYVSAIASPAEDLAGRILGAKAKSFEFCTEESADDFFRIEQDGLKVKITGNCDNSQAAGLGWYLRHIAKVNVSWFSSEPVEFPRRMPKVPEPVTKSAQVETRFFLNYCTYGYTMPWWGWKEWERFIDWMALSGINMPLAITGQEAVWLEVWKEFGMSEDQIRAYFTGPAHLPWHRMANVDGFQGPLPYSWLEGQKALQGKIVSRERELGMTPVLPGFAGHVPAAIAELYPDADIKTLSGWCGFEPTYFLNSEDPLFAKIEKSFLTKQEELYGTDHIYGVDPFNEMDPPSWEPEYLANVSAHIYDSLLEADPQARWLQMTWVFWYKRKHWTPERLEAYLTAVPQDRLVLLDYFCEKAEVWRTSEGFYGQPYIWCYLGNFGGNTTLVGDIKGIEQKLGGTLKDAGDNLTGIGSTLESFDVSPQTYDYLFERAWESEPDIEGWTTDWARSRYGKACHEAEKAWTMLVDSVYHDWAYYGLGTQVDARPSLEGHGTYYTKPDYSYSNDNLLEACRLLLKKPSRRDAYRYDIVNFMTQYMANFYWTARDMFTEAYKAKDVEAMRKYAGVCNEILDDIDSLLGTHESFLLGKWIADARALGVDDAEKAYYEKNARTLLTIWGGPILNDYANRMWNGLVGTYYKGRWNLFFDEAIRCVEAGEEMDEKAFGDGPMRAFEESWTERTDVCPASPSGKTVKLARKLMRKIDSYYSTI